MTKRLLVLTVLSLIAFVATGTSIPTGAENEPQIERPIEVAQRYCPRGRC